MLLTNNSSIKEVILFPSMKSMQVEDDDDEKKPGTDQDKK
jgi:aspartyl-tRNA synthetase